MTKRYFILFLLFIPLLSGEPTAPASPSLLLPNPIPGADHTHPARKTPKAVITPDTLSPVWEASALSGIEESEYHPSWSEKRACWQSPNRAQNLRALYLPSTLILQPRECTDSPWQLSLTCKGIGRENYPAFIPSADPAVAAEGIHLTFTHPAFDIAYENTCKGTRQNFILSERPAGEGPLQVLLASEGLSPIADGNTAVKFVQEDAATGDLQVRMIYKDLKAWDADGRALDARMEVSGNEIALVVEDKDAIYPVTIDPLSTTLHWQGESNQSGGYMGNSIASAGDVNGDGYSDVIVGAYGYDNGQLDEGVLFVYHGSATGLPSTPTYTREYNVASTYFGYTVNTAGDVNGDGYSDVIVGAYIFTNGQSSEGAAFILHGSASGLSALPVWQTESNQTFAWFGLGVAGAGDVNGDGFGDVLVAAEGYDNGQVNEGRAYLYYGSAAGASTTAAWTFETNIVSSALGRVACAGDVNGDGYADILLGASQHTNGQTNEGAIFVFHGSAAGLPAVPNFTGESNQAGANLGYSVGTAGDVNGDGYSDIVAGALYYTNGQTSEGRVYVWMGSAAGIAGVPVTREVNQNDAYLGTAVSCAGDVNGDGYSDIIAGAPYYDNGQSDEGQAYVWSGSAAGISALPVWTMEINQASAYFGTGVSSAGDVNGDGYSDVLVGTWAFDNPELSEGGGFAYLGSGDMLGTTSAWTAESNQVNAQLGVSISSAGDVNGDGFADVIIGVPNYDNGETDEGRAYVYHGSITGLAVAPSWTREINQVSARFGYSVSGAGDVNGDGYSDVIVGAYAWDNGQTDEGGAFVYHGSAAGLLAAPSWTGESNVTYNPYYGLSVSSAGDVNGDGYSDIAVGAVFWTNGQTNEGAVFVHYGSAGGLSTPVSWTYETNVTNTNFSQSLGCAGDVNGDGYADLLVGSPYYDNGETDEGRAFVFHGSTTGLPGSPDWTYESNQVSAALSWSSGSAGDVNGDGFSDVIIGANYYDNGQADEGVAYVFHGSLTGLPAVPNWMSESNQVGAQHGWCVSSAGDVNGDGFGDVVVGAKFYDNPTSDEGITQCYLGSATGLASASGWLTESNQFGSLYGWCVAGAGDVNGDGFSDVMVSSHLFDNGSTDEGMTWLYPGGGAFGTRHNARQYRADLTTPVQQDNSPGGGICAFGIGMFSRSPVMRMPVKLRWEIRANATPFSSQPGGTITSSIAYDAQSASWTNTGLTGIEIKESLSAISVLTRWRVRVKYHPLYMMDGSPASRWYYFDPTGGDLPSNLFAGTSCGVLPEDQILLGGSINAEGNASLNWSDFAQTQVVSYHLLSGSDPRHLIPLADFTPAASSAEEEIAPGATTVWYRIIARDAQGDIRLSNVIELHRQVPASSLTLSPNPAHESFRIISSGQSVTGVVLLDMQGVVLKEWHNLFATELEFALPDLATGIYFLTVTMEGGSRQSLKLMVQ